MSAPGRTQLGDLLRAHRLAGDLTLESLAERTGVSDRTISDIERGVSVGPRRWAAEIQAALDSLPTESPASGSKDSSPGAGHGR